MDFAQSQNQWFSLITKYIIIEESEKVLLNKTVPSPTMTASLQNTQLHQNCYLQNLTASTLMETAHQLKLPTNMRTRSASQMQLVRTGTFRRGKSTNHYLRTERKA